MRINRLIHFSSLTAAFVLPILVLAFYAEPAPAAQTASGAIRGVVKDRAGSPLAGAKVTVRNQETSWSASTLTKSDGSYAFAALAGGRYTVGAGCAGFERASRSDVILGFKTQIVDLVLARTANHESADSRGEDHEHQPDANLGNFQYYDNAHLKAAEPVDPNAAGGYSDSAVATRRELVKDYITGRDSGSRSALPGASPLDEDAIERSASDLLARQAYPQAIEVLKQGLRRFPSSERLEMGLGTALYGRGQYDDALRALLMAVDLAPSDPQPYIFLARAYVAAGARSGVQAAEVLKRIERLSEIEPNSARAHYYYAAVLAKAAPADGLKRQQIEAEFKRAIALDPGYAEARLELGVLDARQGKYRDAIGQYREVIRLKPDLAEAHYRLGQAYAHAGDKTSAQAQFDISEKLRKRSAEGDR